MKTEKISEKYSCVATCPMRNVIAHFANKWSMLLLVILDEFGVMRFNELSRAIPRHLTQSIVGPSENT